MFTKRVIRDAGWDKLRPRSHDVVSALVSKRESKSEPEPELLLRVCINCSGALENISMHYNK